MNQFNITELQNAPGDVTEAPQLELQRPFVIPLVQPVCSGCTLESGFLGNAEIFP